MNKKSLLVLSIATLFCLASCNSNDNPVDPVDPVDDTVYVESVSLEKTTINAHTGETVVLYETVLPANAYTKEVTWLSSNANVATVSSKGVVECLAVGEVTVTVTTVGLDAAEGSPKTATCAITIEDIPDDTVYVESVSLSASEKSFVLGEYEETDLVATVAPETAYNTAINWSSSDTNVCRVDGTGHVIATGTGIATVRAESVGLKEDKTTAFAECAITVTKSLKTLSLTSLVAPSNIATFNENTSALDKIANITSNSDPDGDTFYENEEGTRDFYKVGDDNEFQFNVVGTTINEETLVVETIDNPALTVKVELLDADTGDYVELTTTKTAEYMTISENNDAFQFNASAIGNVFRLTVAANEDAYLSVAQTVEPISLEVEVVDGYNIYDESELSLFHNASDAWDEYRTENGLSDITVNGLVLHKDLRLDSSTFPKEYFYTADDISQYIINYPSDYASWVSKQKQDAENNGLEFDPSCLVGSMKDGMTVYQRNTTPTEDFHFEGNYFTLDASNIPLIYAFDNDGGNNYDDGTISYYDKGVANGQDGSHGALFGFNNLETFANSGYGGNFTLENLKIIGNGERSSSLKYMGGLSTFKVDTVTASFKNVISSKTFATYMVMSNRNRKADLNWARSEEVAKYYTHVRVDRSKNFDSFNSLYYAYGTSDNVITNSFMKGAGGAIFLMDETNYGTHYDNTGYNVNDPHITSTNCYYENWVTGSEPWFQCMGATALITSINAFGSNSGWVGINAKEQGDHKTISVLDEESSKSLVNVIAIDFTGSNAYGNNTTSGHALEGSFTLDNSEYANVNTALDMNRINESPAADSDLVDLKTGYKDTFGSLNSQGFVLETSAGGHGAAFTPSPGNGVVFTGNSTGYMPIDISSSEYATTASNINSAMGGVEVFNIHYTVAQFDAAMSTSFASLLATGDYASLYLQPQPGAQYHYMGVFLGMGTYNFD